ncbi:hypothetical protein [Clostridium sp. UBA5988]|uniref:hypothetical protein n=1 Tax=Clostridium sp. UBA5988 TaxID=1946369 RepID=UPI0032173502
MSEYNAIYVRKVIYLSNSIVIYFNTPMMRFQKHSYLLPSNYSIVDNSTSGTQQNIYILNEKSTRVEEISQGFAVKFTIYNNNDVFIKGKILCVGFIFLTIIRYIISQEGNINNFCSKITLGDSSKPLDISNGHIILDEDKLIYSYNGNNEFSRKIYNEDFYVQIGENKIIPKKVIFNCLENNEVFFFFNHGEIPTSRELYFYTVNNPKTRDAFNLPILGNKRLRFGENDTIILQPGELIPYTSKDINKNFIINVSNENPNRFYGYNDKTITINGWVIVKGETLNPGVQVSFTNININGDMTTELCNGTMILSNVQIDSLLANKI